MTKGREFCRLRVSSSPMARSLNLETREKCQGGEKAVRLMKVVDWEQMVVG